MQQFDFQPKKKKKTKTPSAKTKERKVLMHLSKVKISSVVLQKTWCGSREDTSKTISNDVWILKPKKNTHTYTKLHSGLSLFMCVCIRFARFNFYCISCTILCYFIFFFVREANSFHAHQCYIDKYFKVAINWIWNVLEFIANKPFFRCQNFIQCKQTFFFVIKKNCEKKKNKFSLEDHRWLKKSTSSIWFVYLKAISKTKRRNWSTKSMVLLCFSPAAYWLFPLLSINRTF